MKRRRKIFPSNPGKQKTFFKKHFVDFSSTVFNRQSTLQLYRCLFSCHVYVYGVMNSSSITRRLSDRYIDVRQALDNVAITETMTGFAWMSSKRECRTMDNFHRQFSISRRCALELLSETALDEKRINHRRPNRSRVKVSIRLSTIGIWGGKSHYTHFHRSNKHLMNAFAVLACAASKKKVYARDIPAWKNDNSINKCQSMNCKSFGGKMRM